MGEPGIRTIVAVTTEDDDYADVRRAAEAQARDEAARLILYDLTAGQDPLESPLPTNWSAEGTEDDVPSRLDPDELEAAGRASVARQVREARANEVDAWGWLPETDKGEDLLAYAMTQSRPKVVVPAGLLEATEAPGIEVDVVGAER